MARAVGRSTDPAVHTAEQFTKALADSAPGDLIILDAGVVYSGNFHASGENNPNNKWIYIVSSQLANLPAGTRVSPADAIYMPKIVAARRNRAHHRAYGANYWWLAGIEITANSNYPSGCRHTALHCMTYFL